MSALDAVAQNPRHLAHPENSKTLKFLTFPFHILTLDLCAFAPSIILVMRSLMMPPVVFALLAFVVAPFRSRVSLHLENLALRHQLTVYQPMVHRPYLRPTDRLF